jgi:hypothetical protein
MAIAQLTCPGDLAGSYVVPAGVEIETEPLGRRELPLPDLLPHDAVADHGRVGDASGAPDRCPREPLRLECRRGAAFDATMPHAGQTFTRLAPDRLRFFLRASRSRSTAL